MNIDTSVKLDFSDVLLVPKHSTITSRSDVNLFRDFKFKYAKRGWFGIPLMSSNMDTVTTYETARVFEEYSMLACSAVRFPDLSKECLVDCIKLWGEPVDPATLFLCVDVANGYMERFVNRVNYLRNKYPETILIAGNVVTPEMVQTLILAGADIVKIGIGSGAVCTTRLVAGVGYPQLSAVMECADAAHGLGGHIISDGGCVYPADVVKAFAAGADFVMLGSMLAGHTENWFDGVHYGMSSKRANEALGGLGTYKASEGREVVLQPKGSIADTLQTITGGLRSACAYVGAHRLKDLPKCASFIRVNNTHNRALEGRDV